MGFEDFFGDKRKFRDNNDDHKYYNNNRNKHVSRYPYYGHENSFSFSKILFKIKNNKKLKSVILFAVVLILVTVATFTIVLMPLIIVLRSLKKTLYYANTVEWDFSTAGVLFKAQYQQLNPFYQHRNEVKNKFAHNTKYSYDFK